MNNIVVTLTTVPLRLDEKNEEFGIRPSLKTVLNQTDVQYEVHLNIPLEHRGQYITVPEWLREWQNTYPHLKVFRCKDYGPITKIYPTIKRVSDPNTLIITVDDDLFYVDGFIKSHIEARKRYPEYAIGYAGITSIDETLPADHRGVHPTGKYHFTTSVPEDVRVRVLEGYKTVSYMRSFFSDDLDDFAFSYWADDEILSAYMGYKNIKKIVLACPSCDGDYTPRVETYPVISHVPISGEIHGCNYFRNDERIRNQTKATLDHWYKMGYLER
jgi:hypothetical protein